jgi:RNA polymerase sigma factor (sigma-70 family)
VTVASPPSSDFQLLCEHLAGASDAFGDLVHRHIDMVYSAALRQVRDPALADDVTQAVFLLLWRKAHTFDRGTIVPAWLHRATRYCAANARRLRSIRQHHEQKAATMAPGETHPHLGDAEEHAKLSAVVDRAVAKLSAPDRTAVIMRFFAGKSVEEVAGALKVTPEAARKRTERAVTKLRDILRRMGVSTATPALTTFLAMRCLTQSPAHLTTSVGAMIAASGGSGAVSGAAGAIAKGAAAAMSIKTKVLAAAALLLLFIGGTATYFARPSSAAKPGAPLAANAMPQNVHRIQAYIDGRSRLVIRGNTVQWRHYEFAVPGGHGDVARPTVINGKQWFPAWLGIGIGDAINVSNLYEKLDPPLPTAAVPVTVKPINARGKISIVQLPADDNQFTLILEFDDATNNGPSMYTAEISFPPAEAPAGARLPEHRYADGSIHRGEMKNGLRDGKGEMTWASGARKGDHYRGEWKADLPDGTGVYTLADGGKYVGEFKKGLRDGKGAMSWTVGARKGDRYVGEWKADKIDGTGAYNYADGGSYQGEFHNDVRDGKGTMAWTTGERKGQTYVGEWKNDQPDGAGAYRTSDGSTYGSSASATQPAAANGR